MHSIPGKRRSSALRCGRTDSTVHALAWVRGVLASCLRLIRRPAVLALVLLATLSSAGYAQTLDFGDFAGIGSASSTANVNLRIGASVDAESAATTNALATGDDITGVDDEDGVTLPAALAQSSIGTINVTITNTRGSSAYLNAWIDFNRNGSLTDSGEQIASNTLISNGTSNSPRTINFTVPADASLGTACVRVRLTSTSTPGPTGQSGIGEVEDYAMRICPLMVVCPAVTQLPTATRNAAYNLQLAALGGTGPYTFSVASGSLPTGMTLNPSSGVLSGSPTTEQSSAFTVTVTDSLGCPASRNYTINVVGAGSIITVVGGSGTNNVPIQSAQYIVNGATRTQSSDLSGTTVFSQTNSTINLSTLTINDGGTSKTLNVANLNGGSVSNVTVPTTATNFGVHLNGTATSIASSGLANFGNSAAQISTNTNLNHYIFDDRGEGEPDSIGEYDIRFNYAFTAEDYVVLQERFGNSHIQLQPLDSTGNVIPGSRTVQVRGTHDWNTGYSSSYNSSQPYFLTVIRQTIFGTPDPIFGFRLSISGADCKFFGMSDNPFTDNPTSAGVIGDRVWNDLNENGVQDDGEPGVNGVTVRLLNAADSSVAQTTSTDSAGIYSFTAVAPGEYRVQVVLPGGHAFSSQDAGADDRLDSDVNVTSGLTDIFTMLPCDSISYIDAGIYAKADQDFGDYSNFSSASSMVNAALRIGASVDAEFSATANALATGDDTTGVDDEDGVTWSNDLLVGTSSSITVNVTNTSGSTAFLNAWIDFNGNGALSSGDEQIASNIPIANGTANSNRALTFSVPANAARGALGLRVRLTSTSNPGANGASGTGEVEDHVITVSCPAITLNPTVLEVAKVGSNYNGNTVTASGGNAPYDYAVTSGALPDGIAMNPSTGNFSGTPTTGNGPGSSVTITATDKDGCTASRTYNFQVCPAVSLVPAVLPSGMENAGYNETLGGTGGTAPYLFSVSSGVLPSGLSLNQSTGVISGRPTSTAASTFTISVVDANGCTGARTYTMTPATGTDFGDFTAFGSASSVVVHTLQIGALTDAESTPVTNSSATGDDITDLADEDGINLPAYLNPGTASSMIVNVTNTSGSSAFLNAWIDFNGNGVLTDSGEQVASNTLIASGSTNSSRTINFTAPLTASLGTIGVRVRLTSTSSPGPTGAKGNGEVEDTTTTVTLSADFGDFSLFGSANSVVSNALRMGALVDSETAATLNSTATGDDINGVDDEDGVTLPASVTQGESGASLSVRVTNTSGSDGYVNGWIDFNNNGVLTDPGEQIVFNDTVTSGTNNANRTYTFNVPTGAATGAVGVRFRLSSTATPGSTGFSGIGEVEDHRLTILATSDFGDYSRFQSASSLINNSLRMGALVDAEFSANANLAATGDDITNVNDEDGAAVQAILVQGQAGVAVTLNVTNLSGAAAYLNGWIDFNNNGVLTDAGEQIVGNVIVPNGTQDDYQTFYFDVPSNATIASVGMRFRLTSVSAPGSVGAVGSGEVEDYTTSIVAPSSNFRDYFYAIRQSGTQFFLDEISVYNPNSATPTVSVNPGILNLNTASPGFNANASNAVMNGLALDWLNRRFYWAVTSSGSSGYNFKLHSANYDNVSKTWNYQQVTGSTLTNIPFNTGVPNSSSAGSGAFPRAAFYGGKYFAGGQLNNNVAVWNLDSVGLALGSPPITDYPNFFHLNQTFNGGDFVIRPQDGFLVTSTIYNGANTLFNQFITDGFNPSGPAATTVNIDSQIPSSVHSAVQIAGVGGVSRLYGLGANGTTLYRIDRYDEASPQAVRVGPLPTATYTDLSEGISSSVTSLGVKGIVYDDANGLADNTINGTGTNAGGSLFAMLVDSAGKLVDSFPVKSDGTFILGGAVANNTYTVVLSTTYGSLGATAPPAALPQGWVNVGEYLGSGSGSDGVVNGVLSVSIGNAGIVNAKLGIVEGCSIGNLVWNDANNNGVRDAGESGIGGVTVQLWTPGSDNAIGGTGTAADTLVATTTTDGTGTYNFTNLFVGKYFIRVTPAALFATASSAVSGDNGVDNDNNGSQPGGRGTAVFSPVIDLARGKEPGNLASGGSNAETSVDFGLLTATDYGDFAGFGSAGSAVVPNLQLGALNDSEFTPQTNADGTADDLAGLDDEDGVSLPASIVTGGLGSMTVSVTNTSGSSAFLHAWMDFNRNGVLTDTGEQIASNILIANGTSQSNRTINFTVPTGASAGVVGVRVRLTSVSTPGSTGTIGNGEVEDHTTTIVQPTLDFGDELDFADASSTASTALRIGALVDVEGRSNKTADADGDDISGSDDEDGVIFPYLTAGQPVTLPVSVTNTTGATGYINAWIDFNNNGVLTDAGEQVAINVPVPNGTTNGTATLNFNVPTNAVTAATSLGTRFRITNVQNPGPTGQAGIGEVEDHPVIILAPLTDFGDFSGAPDVSNTASSNLRLGALVDTEYASTANATATGDDVTGVDDEDGVTLPSMTAGAPVTLIARVTNNTGATGYLNAWIDFNNNGVFTDAGEQVSSNVLVASGTNNVNRSLNLTIPPTAATGVSVGVRVRLTNDISPGSTGAGGIGEVEDYVTVISPPTTDFGDLSILGSASSTVVTGLRIGALVDTEFSPTMNATATGDDITAMDDEDGVTFPTMTAGAPATIPVQVTNLTGSDAYLNAWIDFNNNGSLDDPGEQIAADLRIATGANNALQNVSVTIPAATLTGINLGARFRLTSTASPDSVGASGNGEVEDYVVVVTAPTTDFGDYSGFADASQGVNPALRLGALLDAEFVSTRNATATGDDITGSDDEDGVLISTITAGETLILPVAVTNTTGGNGFLNAWFDFNNNGVLTDSGERIATNVVIPTGTTNGVVNLTVAVPATAVTGTSIGVRFRLSAPSGLGPTGTNPLAGEIEDYVVTITAPTNDFGDHSRILPASSTARSDLVMGSLVDAEHVGLTNVTATGDDTTGVDDEDGVVMPASMQPGTTVVLPVTVKNLTGANAYLHAWIDFNNDGNLNNTTIANGGERLEPARLINGQSKGTILREYWTGLSGTSVANLTAYANYPNNPNGSDLRTEFSTPTNWADNMGQRLRGWVYPPVSGEYTFWVSGDDETHLYLSTDETPANTSLIARVPYWSSSLQWTKYAEQKSVKITLQAGRPYYIEALMKEGGGGDNLAAGWELPGTSTGPVVIAGQYLAPWTASGQPPSDSLQEITFTVPLLSSPGSNRAVRFRLTDTLATGPTGFSGTGEVEDYSVVITSADNDFGDWSGAAGASNGLSTNLFMGATVDGEFFATTNATATGDDEQGTDDEDGVMLPPLTAGGIFETPVVVTNITGTAAYLNGWIDFNNNGSFSDAGEQVATNMIVANGGNGVTITPSVNVPTTAVTGVNLGVRFRLTAENNPGPTGALGGVGEVEDYVVNISAPTLDQGDYSQFALAASTASNALRIGALVDVEYSATLNPTATGDDTRGLADEDGVGIPSMTAGGPAVMPVTVTNTTGSSAFLNAWVDFNNNGVLTDAGEQIATNIVIAPGVGSSVRNVNFTAAPTAVTGLPVGVRVRLTSVSSPGPVGTSGTGEVEDYIAVIAAPPLDFGDWSALPDASSTVDPRLLLGALADTEYASTRNSTASGDDSTGIDDEDGVVMPAMIAGAPATIPVVVTNTTGAPAYLNAWFDFNDNKAVNDPGEQIAADILIPSGTVGGTVNITLTVPAAAITGASLGTRFRLTSVISPGFTGNNGIGEVEDHAANIAVPVTDFGDWSRAADASNIASSNLRMGALADSEYVPTNNANATGDDTTASDDEDGVTLPLLTPGTSGQATVVVTNNSGAPGYLNAWIDFNDNGSFADAGEQVAANVLVANGTNGSTRTLSFVTPVTAIPGNRGTRFRLTADQNAAPTGAGGLGEVEDHMAQFACLPFLVNPTTLPTPTVGTPYSQTISALGIHPPFTFSVSSGTLPAGLTLDSSTGVISGTPSSSATTLFTLTATDANGCTATRSHSITPLCPAISITPSSLAQGTVGTAYSRTLAASGGTAPYGSWTVTSGALPTGLTLNASTGVISGTPTAPASPATSFTVRVTDTYGCQGSQTVSLQICPVVSLSATTPAVGMVGTSYSHAVSASGGAAPYSFAITTGTLPPGLNLNTSTGVISGTPTQAVSRSITLRATDANGCSGTRSYTFSTACPAISLTPLTLPTAYFGGAYDQTLVASGGTAPYTYIIEQGALPTGLFLASNGIISGAPSVVGDFTFTVKVQDTYGCIALVDYSLAVRTISIGNLVFEDTNNNGLFDVGEPGLAGARVQLFATGDDSAIGGSGSAADTQTGSDILTPATGAYLFTSVPPGKYYVKVTPPKSYLATSGTPALTDNDVNGNNDGSQPGGPGTALFSPVITLAGGTEPVTDGDSDADTNLSIDFGLWATSKVGNFVFLDINGDGVLNPGERIQDVLVLLYEEDATPGVDEAVGAAVSDSKGRYLIENINNGSYFLHVPASQFAPGMPLEGLVPMAAVSLGDDDAGQDLIFDNAPASNGASTGVFSVRAGFAPVGAAESGADGGFDDDEDDRVDLTHDLGFASPLGSGFASASRAERVLSMEAGSAESAQPATLLTWSQARDIGGPLDDPDADGAANLLEYALGTDPLSGLGSRRIQLEQDPDTSRIGLSLTRPNSPQEDITVSIEAITDLTASADPAAWTRLALPAAAIFNADGTVTRRYADIDADFGSDTGFIRVRVELDANRDGTPEAAALSPILGWSHQTFAPGTRTFSMPLVQHALFTGRAAGLIGREITLPVSLPLPAGSHYLEVLDGTLAGRHFEIDAAASSGKVIALTENAPSAILGARIALRTHWTLAGLLPPEAFAAADRLQLFDPATSAYTSLSPAGGAWTADVLGMNARPLPPQEALLVQTRDATVNRTFTGELRPASLPLPSAVGTRLIGTGWPAAITAPVAGLHADATPELADRLRLWNGDTAPGVTGYSGYYLDDSAGSPAWRPQAAESSSAVPELTPFHGFFLIRVGP